MLFLLRHLGVNSGLEYALALLDDDLGVVGEINVVLVRQRAFVSN